MSKLVAEYLQHPLSASANIALLDDGNVGGVLGATLGSKVDYPSGGNDGDLLAKDGTVAEWIAPEAAGLTLIATEIFSAVSAVSINNCFSATYKNYRIIFDATTSGTSRTQMRLRASGTDISANYNWSFANIAATVGVEQTTGQATLVIAPGDTSAGKQFTTLDINEPFAAVPTPMNIATLAGSNVARLMFARHSASTSVDGFSLIAESGTTSGEVRIYGYRD